MKKEKKSLFERKFFPVIFMFILTAFFITILSAMYNGTTQIVKENKIEKKQRQILSLFDLPVDKDLNETYEKHIKEIDQKDISYYKATKNGKLLGYCFQINGSGLWGKIEAFLAFKSDLKTIQGIDFISQNETPGLGARIAEIEFRKQFQGKKLIKNGEVIELSLVSEDYDDPTSQQIRQITGATSSSKAVITMIHKEMQRITDIMEK